MLVVIMKTSMFVPGKLCIYLLCTKWLYVTDMIYVKVAQIC